MSHIPQSFPCYINLPISTNPTGSASANRTIAGRGSQSTNRSSELRSDQGELRQAIGREYSPNQPTTRQFDRHSYYRYLRKKHLYLNNTMESSTVASPVTSGGEGSNLVVEVNSVLDKLKAKLARSQSQQPKGEANSQESAELVALIGRLQNSLGDVLTDTVKTPTTPTAKVFTPDKQPQLGLQSKNHGSAVTNLPKDRPGNPPTVVRKFGNAGGPMQLPNNNFTKDARNDSGVVLDETEKQTSLPFTRTSARSFLGHAIQQCKSREEMTKEPKSSDDSKAHDTVTDDQSSPVVPTVTAPENKRRDQRELPWKIRLAKKKMERGAEGVQQYQSVPLVSNTSPKPYQTPFFAQSASLGNVAAMKKALQDNSQPSHQPLTVKQRPLYSQSFDNIKTKGVSLASKTFSADNLSPLMFKLHQDSDESEDEDADDEGEMFSFKDLKSLGSGKTMSDNSLQMVPKDFSKLHQDFNRHHFLPEDSMKLAPPPSFTGSQSAENVSFAPKRPTTLDIRRTVPDCRPDEPSSIPPPPLPVRGAVPQPPPRPQSKVVASQPQDTSGEDASPADLSRSKSSPNAFERGTTDGSTENTLSSRQNSSSTTPVNVVKFVPKAVQNPAPVTSVEDIRKKLDSKDTASSQKPKSAIWENSLKSQNRANTNDWKKEMVAPALDNRTVQSKKSEQKKTSLNANFNQLSSQKAQNVPNIQPVAFGRSVSNDANLSKEQPRNVSRTNSVPEEKSAFYSPVQAKTFNMPSRGFIKPTLSVQIEETTPDLEEKPTEFIPEELCVTSDGPVFDVPYMKKESTDKIHPALQQIKSNIGYENDIQTNKYLNDNEDKMNQPDANTSDSLSVEETNMPSGSEVTSFAENNTTFPPTKNTLIKEQETVINSNSDNTVDSSDDATIVEQANDVATKLPEGSGNVVAYYPEELGSVYMPVGTTPDNAAEPLAELPLTSSTHVPCEQSEVFSSALNSPAVNEDEDMYRSVPFNVNNKCPPLQKTASVDGYVPHGQKLVLSRETSQTSSGSFQSPTPASFGQTEGYFANHHTGVNGGEVVSPPRQTIPLSAPPTMNTTFNFSSKVSLQDPPASAPVWKSNIKNINPVPFTGSDNTKPIETNKPAPRHLPMDTPPTKSVAPPNNFKSVVPQSPEVQRKTSLPVQPPFIKPQVQPQTRDDAVKKPLRKGVSIGGAVPPQQSLPRNTVEYKWQSTDSISKTKFGGFAVPPLPTTEMKQEEIKRKQEIEKQNNKSKWGVVDAPKLMGSAVSVGSHSSRTASVSRSSESLSSVSSPPPPKDMKGPPFGQGSYPNTSQAADSSKVKSVWEKAVNSSSSSNSNTPAGKPWKEGRVADDDGRIVKNILSNIDSDSAVQVSKKKQDKVGTPKTSIVSNVKESLNDSHKTQNITAKSTVANRVPSNSGKLNVAKWEKMAGDPPLPSVGERSKATTKNVKKSHSLKLICDRTFSSVDGKGRGGASPRSGGSSPRSGMVSPRLGPTSPRSGPSSRKINNNTGFRKPGFNSGVKPSSPQVHSVHKAIRSIERKNNVVNSSSLSVSQKFENMIQKQNRKSSNQVPVGDKLTRAQKARDANIKATFGPRITDKSSWTPGARATDSKKVQSSVAKFEAPNVIEFGYQIPQGNFKLSKSKSNVVKTSLGEKFEDMYNRIEMVATTSNKLSKSKSGNVKSFIKNFEKDNTVVEETVEPDTLQMHPVTRSHSASSKKLMSEFLNSKNPESSMRVNLPVGGKLRKEVELFEQNEQEDLRSKVISKYPMQSDHIFTPSKRLQNSFLDAKSSSDNSARVHLPVGRKLKKEVEMFEGSLGDSGDIDRVKLMMHPVMRSQSASSKKPMASFLDAPTDFTGGASRVHLPVGGKLRKEVQMFEQGEFVEMRAPVVRDNSTLIDVCGKRVSQIIESTESRKDTVTFTPVDQGKKVRVRPLSLDCHQLFSGNSIPPEQPKSIMKASKPMKPPSNKPSYAPNQFEAVILPDAAEQKKQEIAAFFQQSSQNLTQKMAKKPSIFSREQSIDMSGNVAEEFDNLLSNTDLASQEIDDLFSETILGEDGTNSDSRRRSLTDFLHNFNSAKTQFSSNSFVSSGIQRSKTVGDSIVDYSQSFGARLSSSPSDDDSDKTLSPTWPPYEEGDSVSRLRENIAIAKEFLGMCSNSDDESTSDVLSELSYSSSRASSHDVDPSREYNESSSQYCHDAGKKSSSRRRRSLTKTYKKDPLRLTEKGRRCLPKSYKKRRSPHSTMNVPIPEISVTDVEPGEFIVPENNLCPHQSEYDVFGTPLLTVKSVKCLGPAFRSADGKFDDIIHDFFNDKMDLAKIYYEGGRSRTRTPKQDNQRTRSLETFNRSSKVHVGHCKVEELSSSSRRKFDRQNSASLLKTPCSPPVKSSTARLHQPPYLPDVVRSCYLSSNSDRD